MKASQIRDLTEEEIQERLADANTELFNLRMQTVAGQLEKPSRIREIRRDVARMKTVHNERKKGVE